MPRIINYLCWQGVDYTDCIFCWGVIPSPPQERGVLGMTSNYICGEVRAIGQIDLFENYLHWIGIHETIIMVRCMQTNDYYQIELSMLCLNSWNHFAVWKLFISSYLKLKLFTKDYSCWLLENWLLENYWRLIDFTWNHITVCKKMISDRNNFLKHNF